MNYFIGEMLQPSPLRFNYSSITAKHLYPRSGLKTYGPYDSGIFGRDQINCAVIYPASLKKEKDILINGLTNGNGSFVGFQRLFRIPILFSKEKILIQETVSEIQKVSQSLSRENGLDLVFAIASLRNEQLYSTVKAELLGNGIPNQVVTGGKLRLPPSQLPYTLENIALQIYAKAGGRPWTVASSDRRQELVIGISRAQDRQRNFVVGFITLFSHDGDYQFMYSMAPQPVSFLDWEQGNYVKGLSQLIVDAYTEYSKLRGKPDSLVLHLCKRPGRFREVEAVKRAIDQIGIDIPYALIHLNSDSNYRLFDASHSTYIPESGIKVELNNRNALLLLDGRVNGQRRRRGVPRVLEITMDRRSTMPVSEFTRLVRQVYDFARVNWRGFNAQAVPATLNYSYLVARLVAEIGATRWNAIASAGRLRDKIWFL